MSVSNIPQIGSLRSEVNVLIFKLLRELRGDDETYRHEHSFVKITTEVTGSVGRFSGKFLPEFFFFFF